MPATALLILLLPANTSTLLRRARCRQLDPAHAQQSEDADVWEAVERAFTLLRSRYTAPAFWRAGQLLFQAAVAAAATSAQRQAAQGYLAVAASHLEEAEAPAPAAQPAGAGNRSYLFEGILSRPDDEGQMSRVRCAACAFVRMHAPLGVGALCGCAHTTANACDCMLNG